MAYWHELGPYRNARRCSYRNYGNGKHWRRNKYTSYFDAWT